MYFQIKISYLTQLPNGTIQSIKGQFLVKDTGFIEAETQLAEKLKGFIDEYKMESISRSNVNDTVIDETKDFYYKVTIQTVFADADSGKEKKGKEIFLVQANDIEETMKKIKERFSGSVVNSEVVAVAKVALDDVFENLELNSSEKEGEESYIAKGNALHKETLEGKTTEEKISDFVDEDENEIDIKIDSPSDFGL